jgi:hypothetical protein
MLKHSLIKTSLLAASLLSFTAAQAATMTKADYKASKTTISASYTADKQACAALAANAKDVCIEQAKGKEKVALAELEYGYTGKVGDRNKILVVKADTTYATAKERCDDLAGNPKDVCVKEAKAVQIKALADAKLGKEVGAAQRDATADKREADLKVALEKCDALAGTAKSACVDTAKASFGSKT